MGYRPSINLIRVDGFGLLHELMIKFEDLYESSSSIDDFLVDIVDSKRIVSNAFVKNSPYLNYSSPASEILVIFELKNQNDRFIYM